jgi:acyl phosphate:glycerol-3-phosphate acyltransferase
VIGPILLAAVAGYLLGAIPSGVIVGRVRGTDPRSAGSRRIGTTNVLCTLGVEGAVAVLAMDVAKGAAAALAGVAIGEAMGSGGSWPGAVAAVSAVVGHVRSVFIGFGGGRGVATGAGALAVLAPLSVAVAIPVFALVVWRTRYVSLGSIAAALTTAAVVAVLVWGTAIDAPVLVAAVAIVAVIVVSHADNIERLRSGTERRLGEHEAPSGG